MALAALMVFVVPVAAAAVGARLGGGSGRQTLFAAAGFIVGVLLAQLALGLAGWRTGSRRSALAGVLGEGGAGPSDAAGTVER